MRGGDGVLHVLCISYHLIISLLKHPGTIVCVLYTINLTRMLTRTHPDCFILANFRPEGRANLARGVLLGVHLNKAPVSSGCLLLCMYVLCMLLGETILHAPRPARHLAGQPVA